MTDFLGGMIFGAACCIVVLLLAANFLSEHRATACVDRWSASGMRSEFRVSSGCRVELHGKMIPESAIRVELKEPKQ